MPAAAAVPAYQVTDDWQGQQPKQTDWAAESEAPAPAPAPAAPAPAQSQWGGSTNWN